MLGVVLQQTTLILWLACVPIGILWSQVRTPHHCFIDGDQQQ